MKNVAKKSTSLKPSCLAQNGLPDRLPNGVTGAKNDVKGSVIELNSSHPNCNNKETRNVTSNNRIIEMTGNEGLRKDSVTVDENSNDSLVEVSCVNVVDDVNTTKSPVNDDHGPSSSCSTPVSVTGPSGNRIPAGAVNGIKADHTSDDEVVICDNAGPDISCSTTKLSRTAEKTAQDSVNKRRGNGPDCRVEIFEIVENGPDLEGDELPTKFTDTEGVGRLVSDDKDVEVIAVDNPVTPATVVANGDKATQRSGLKRMSSDLSSSDVNQTKKSRLEAAEAEVLTSFINAKIVTDRESKINLSAKQLNQLVLSCIEDYINKSHGSIIKQLRVEVEQLKKSRDQWKETAEKLRKEVILVQTTQQRTERRRSTTNRIQRRNVGCQAQVREKVSSSSGRSLAKSSLATLSDAGKSGMPPNQMLTAGAGTVVMQSPSILPPASANLMTTQRLRMLHHQTPRLSNSGLLNGPLRPGLTPVTGGAIVPMTIRPQGLSGSSVTIDLTAEEDTRTKQSDTVTPTGILSSMIPPGNMVLAPNSTNAYLLYAQPSRGSAMMKTGGPVDAATVVTSLPALALNTSPAAGDGFHSLPSLVSVNNRQTGALLQVVNMRPPPPLQSAPLRASPLPILPTSSASRIPMPPVGNLLHHPAPLPSTSVNQTAPSSAKQIPPKPTLKLSRVAQGIVLSWNATVGSHQEEPSTYQLYAYQQGSDIPNSNLWKKVGNVKALALPMACTLTQFQVGNRYHFAVRAVDQFGRVGSFSEPGSIHLEGAST